MDTKLLLIVFTIIIFIYVLVTFLILRLFIRNNEKQRHAEILLKNHEIIIPLRLQAYERITLFLERISPDSLLTRHNQTGLTSHQLHTILLSSIRNEFEHNLSQQVYMTIKAWEMVKNARIQMTKIINTAAAAVNPNAPSIELSKKILEIAGEYDKYPTTTAIEFIKKEIQKQF